MKEPLQGGFFVLSRLKFKKMPIFIPDAAVFTPVTVVSSVVSLSGGVFDSIGQIDGTNTTANSFNPVGNVVIH